MMKEMGGYFEWYIEEGKMYHEQGYALNSGRACYSYLLKQKGYKRVYLPKYICDSMVTTTHKAGASINYYDVNQNFLPSVQHTMNAEEVIVIVNYFGLVGQYIPLLKAFYKNVIVDNTQAFFQLPEEHTDTFYSPRKFFGVADGGYVYTDHKGKDTLPQAISYERYLYLLKRLEKGAEEGFQDYQKSEALLGDMPIARMSVLTSKILSSMPYETCRLQREANGIQLHEAFKKDNRLYQTNPDAFESMLQQGPMVYPLWSEKEDLKMHLIKNHIYVATYWKEALERVEANGFEHALIRHLVPLPIDHRYNKKDMAYVIALVKGGM